MGARSPKAKPGRKRGQTSPRIRRAARKNGAAGGRPRDCLPADELAKLGDEPADIEGIRTWNIRMLALTNRLAAGGKIGSELAATLRAGCAALERALPAPRKIESPDDPDDDDGDEPDGPELETDDGAGAPLHVG